MVNPVEKNLKGEGSSQSSLFLVDNRSTTRGKMLHCEYASQP